MNTLSWMIRMGIKRCFVFLFSRRVSILNDEQYNKILYYIVFGKIGDFHNPQTINEYIISMKLYSNEEGYENYTDKYIVRSYVKEVIGDQYLNEILAVYDNPEDIEFEELPDSFALKATHGSGYNIVVSDKNSVDRELVKRKFKKWMNRNYYYLSREKNYRNIKPRIVCEKYLQANNKQPLNEMKLWCFNGKVKLIADTRIANGKRCTNLYDSEKNKLDVRMGTANHELPISDNIDEMIRIAELLALRFRFVRVDLYDVDGIIVFSELTFHPGGGLVPFEPDIWDYRIASFMES